MSGGLAWAGLLEVERATVLEAKPSGHRLEQVVEEATGETPILTRRDHLQEAELKRLQAGMNAKGAQRLVCKAVEVFERLDGIETAGDALFEVELLLAHEIGPGVAGGRAFLPHFQPR